MKGTRPRGRWLEEDEAAARALAASVKDRAENLMIVDLLRNDLGRVARFGSVRVPSLFDVERYRTVWQMTSTIEAEVPEGTSLAALFAALFPCGSVTGAPKVVTMRLIAALEEAPRGAYCGGITWDSTPEGEYAEALAKAAVLTHETPEFELIETLRLEDGGYARLERHLGRLAASARYFGWPDPTDAARAALAEYAKASSGMGSTFEGEAGEIGAPGEGRADATRPRVDRVRLLVGAGGNARVEGSPFGDDAAHPRPVAIASRPVSRRDPFRYHKTSRREVLDALRAERPHAFDVLLYNEEGEFTEFTRGNLVVELDGELWTPPRECGLLAGVLRDECIERGEVRERVIRREDLERADAVWFINSLRGWVPVWVVW